MCRYAIAILAVPFCILPAAQTQANSGDSAAAIDVTQLNISHRTLKLCYQIKNHSEREIWVCENICATLDESDFEAYMAEDKQTLVIRRRLDVTPMQPAAERVQPTGRYVRLGAGQSRDESLLLSLPVESRCLFASHSKPDEQCAKSLALEIGYYPGDMPGMIRGILEKEKKSSAKETLVFTNDPYATPLISIPIKAWLGGSLLKFNWYNWPDGGLVKHRGEEILIRWTGWTRMGEQVLRTGIDDLQIPYKEEYDRPKVSPPDMNGCTRVEIQYQPSMLEYFFPYASERALLNAEEIKHLQSLQALVARDAERIEAFVREVGKGLPGGFFAKGRAAHVVCYRDDEGLTSFTIYSDRWIVTDEERCLRYTKALPSLEALTLPIQPFQLRLGCANNLRNLSSLLQFLYSNRRTYRASDWCGAIVRDRRSKDVPLEYRMRYLKCPDANKGKCNYAMNPNCRRDSPGDVVLLFETKAGWNQRGGPELFTFDNHDPKGGCVLLNDGTVKFVRTKEELQQLRWR